MFQAALCSLMQALRCRRLLQAMVKGSEMNEVHRVSKSNSQLVCTAGLIHCHMLCCRSWSWGSHLWLTLAPRELCWVTCCPILSPSLRLAHTLQVMVMGSEVTEEYRVQVFTPPYLQTGASRPTITTAPAAVSTAASPLPANL